MTTLQIDLPDASVRDDQEAGLWAPEKIERILRERLRPERIERMRAARDALSDDPMPAMTPEEISAEIDAYRAAGRRAADS